MVGSDQAPGDGHASTGAAAELTSEEQWLRLWAFGTSPHGLGIPEERLWRLTHREFKALSDVYERTLHRWAFERAQFQNAHWDAKGTPWLPEDFLGRGSREMRKMAHQREEVEIALANAALSRIQPGVDADGVPAWAKGPYRGGQA